MHFEKYWGVKYDFFFYKKIICLFTTLRGTNWFLPKIMFNIREKVGQPIY